MTVISWLLKEISFLSFSNRTTWFVGLESNKLTLVTTIAINTMKLRPLILLFSLSVKEFDLL